jgi:AcrR family transcriptional regulator
MAEVQDRRELILSAAAELFARNGVRATTVRAIADAVGIFSGSLYHYFASKDAILCELLSRYMETVRDRLTTAAAATTTPAGQLRRLMVAGFEVAAQQPHPTAIWQNEAPMLRGRPEFGAVMATVTAIQKQWLAVLEAGVADGSFRDDIPPWLFYQSARDTIVVSVRWQQPGTPYTARQLAENVTSVFLHGYAAVPA